MLIAATLLSATLGTPPKPYTESVTLPGKTPSSERELQDSYKLSYFSGDPAPGQARLQVSLTVTLKQDGSYELVYNALELGPLNVRGKGRDVYESGGYSFSGGVLLLESRSVRQVESQGGVSVGQQIIANEKHVWIVQVEKGRLHVAGRCAKYQIEPECQMSTNIWFSMVEELRLKRVLAF